MGRADYYKSGDWNAECEVCGQKYKASKLRLRWDGLQVCPKDFEYRHPQDFVRGIRDNQSVPWSRPEPADVFIGFCTPDGMSGITEYAVADCAIVEYISPAFDPSIYPLDCIPLVYTTTTTVQDTQWACSYLQTSTSLTINGMIGIQ